MLLKISKWIQNAFAENITTMAFCFFLLEFIKVDQFQISQSSSIAHVDQFELMQEYKIQQLLVKTSDWCLRRVRWRDEMWDLTSRTAEMRTGSGKDGAEVGGGVLEKRRNREKLHEERRWYERESKKERGCGGEIERSEKDMWSSLWWWPVTEVVVVDEKERGSGGG